MPYHIASCNFIFHLFSSCSGNCKTESNGQASMISSCNVAALTVFVLKTHWVFPLLTICIPAVDAAGHLQWGEAFPAGLCTGLWQTEALLCGVRRRPRSGLWHRLSHTYAGWTWRGRPSPESLTQLDLGVYPQEACRTSLLTIKRQTHFIHCANWSVNYCTSV